MGAGPGRQFKPADSSNKTQPQRLFSGRSALSLETDESQSGNLTMWGKLRERATTEWENLKQPRILGLIALLVVVLIGSWYFWPQEETPGSGGKPGGRSDGEFVTPSPTREAPPVFPPEAMQNTEAGARAAVEYYYQALNYTQRSLKTELDTAPLERVMALPECEACANLLTRFRDEVAAKGMYVKDGVYSVEIVRAFIVPKPDGNNDYVVEVAEQRSAGKVYNSDGSVDREIGTAHGQGSFTLAMGDIGWHVLSFDPK